MTSNVFLLLPGTNSTNTRQETKMLAHLSRDLNQCLQSLKWLFCLICLGLHLNMLLLLCDSTCFLFVSCYFGSFYVFSVTYVCSMSFLSMTLCINSAKQIIASSCFPNGQKRLSTAPVISKTFNTRGRQCAYFQLQKFTLVRQKYKTLYTFSH